MPIVLSILSMISGAFGPIAQWIKKKQELEALKQETERQVVIQQLKLAQETARAEGSAATVRLKATGKNFKYLTFAMWFTPFCLGIVRPDLAAIIFEHFNEMPAWYAQSCTLLIFAVWGISVSAPVVQSIFSSLGSYMKNVRLHKEEMAKINREAVFASLRKAQGALSQRTVDEVNRALDAGEAAQSNDEDRDQALG